MTLKMRRSPGDVFRDVGFGSEEPSIYEFAPT
jgi:hypothetical protein